MGFIEEEKRKFEVLNAIASYFELKSEREKKRQKKLAKEFLELIVNDARNRTDEELAEFNYLSFLELKDKKEFYQEEFKEAMYIFEMNLMDIFNDIKNALINAFWS